MKELLLHPPTGLVAIDIREALPRGPGSAKARVLGDIRIIVVHYDDQRRPASYDTLSRLEGQAWYHIHKNWGKKERPVYGFGLMYHYNIDGLGRLWRTQAEERIVWHANDANRYALAIKLDCGAGQQPTNAQYGTLRGTLRWLCFNRPDIPAARKDVYGHGEVTAEVLEEYGIRGVGNKTACPGEALEWVQAFRNGVIR